LIESLTELGRQGVDPIMRIAQTGIDATFVERVKAGNDGSQRAAAVAQQGPENGSPIGNRDGGDFDRGSPQDGSQRREFLELMPDVMGAILRNIRVALPALLFDGGW